MSGRLRAGIVGLGQVGLLFDDDPRRDGVWTHFAAYRRLAHRYDLVAACDPDALRRARAQDRDPALRLYASLDEMLAAERLDVVSLCTPPDLHLPQLDACAGRVRAVICEKPLAGGRVDASRRVVERCTQHGTLVGVNYYKRYEPATVEARRQLAAGAIGRLRTASALYAGPLDAVGAHALDLLVYLGGPMDLRHASRRAADRMAAVFEFGDEGLASLLEVGPREDLVFEVDLVGSDGRLRILHNVSALELGRFESSPRYSGYRELASTAIPVPAAERFVPLFEEVAAAIDSGDPSRISSSAASALEGERLLEALSRVNIHVH